MDVIFLVLSKSFNLQFKLYNNLGQKVQESTIINTNQTINVENLASGMYFYELSTQNKTLQGKLLKL